MFQLDQAPILHDISVQASWGTQVYLLDTNQDSVFSFKPGLEFQFAWGKQTSVCGGAITQMSWRIWGLMTWKVLQPPSLAKGGGSPQQWGVHMNAASICVCAWLEFNCSLSRHLNAAWEIPLSERAVLFQLFHPGWGKKNTPKTSCAKFSDKPGSNWLWSSAGCRRWAF